MKVAFYTLGCKVNQYETQHMTEQLISKGYELVDENSMPDVYVVNSCTVTSESDRKSKQQVRKFRRLFPQAVIALTGCMPQAFPELQEDFMYADVILGNSSGRDIYGAIQQFITTGQRVISISPHSRDENITNVAVTDFTNHTRAFLKIEDGCDRFCSYCIIPKARGFVRSKQLDDIKDEVQKLVANGFVEIVLVGINLSAYGRDIDTDLLSAINAVSSVNGIQRIRLGSLEPFILDEVVLEKLSLNNKFCPHFHISLQSGSDKVLQKMNRKYDTIQYKQICDNIEKHFSSFGITTDIMVGFPGENNQDFTDSMDFVRQINFNSTHVFAYSQRAGTPAAEFTDQVDGGTKAERCRAMIALCEELKVNNFKKFLGSTQEVLVEREDEDYYLGFTKTYTEVKISKGRDLQTGTITSVKITGYDNQWLIGEL